MPLTLTPLSNKQIKDREALDTASRNKYDAFVHSIPNANNSSQLVGNIKKLKGADNQFQLTLAGTERATYTLEGSVITFLQIGGHT